MLRPDLVGPKQFLLNYNTNALITADLAATDTAFDPPVISPYAYTATVREDYDSTNYTFAAQTIAAGNRNAFGLFLTADNNKGNLLFQVSGKVSLTVVGYPAKGSFFFGRVANSTPIASTKVAPANGLGKYTLLASHTTHPVPTVSTWVLNDSISEQVFSLGVTPATGFPYSFGYMIDATGAATAVIAGTISLAFRKYGSELEAFRPTR